MEEIWKFIPNYEGIYKISTLGNIMSIKNGKRKAIIHHTGYFVISLNKNGIKKQYRLHRLIAIAFIDNINNYPQINHINGVKTDNRIENLEWCTAKQNTIHAWENDLCKTSEKQRNRAKEMLGELHPNSRVILDTQTGIFYYGIREAAAAINYNYSTLRNYFQNLCINKTSLMYV